jgi:hypothetical protein
MADREIHTVSSGGSGMGILGVVVGAIIVIGAIFFVAGGSDWFSKSGGGPSVTINAPQTPAAPKAPSTTGSR